MSRIKYCYWPDEFAVKVDSSFISDQTVICKTSVGKDAHKYGIMIVDALNTDQAPADVQSADKFLDEIESILAFRSSVEKQHAGIKQLLKEHDTAIRTKDKATIAKLRKALNKIAHDKYSHNGISIGDIQWMRNIAKQTLKEIE